MSLAISLYPATLANFYFLNLYFFPCHAFTLAVSSAWDSFPWLLTGIVLFLFFSIEVELIYNIVLISGVQQSNSVIHIHMYVFFFRFFSIIGYYKIMNMSLCYTVIFFRSQLICCFLSLHLKYTPPINSFHIISLTSFIAAVWIYLVNFVLCLDFEVQECRDHICLVCCSIIRHQNGAWHKLSAT